MRRKLQIKFVIALTLSIAITMSGCSNNGNDGNPDRAGNHNAPSESMSPAASETNHSADRSPFGKYETPIAIQVGKSAGPTDKYPEGDSIENNIWTRFYKDELGIDVKIAWTALMGEQYDQKTKLAIASGNMPDLMTVNAQQLAQLVENDQIADLTDAVEQYASEFTNVLLNADGGMAMKAVTYNGKIMAIPSTGSMIDSSNVLWIRQDWLDKLGLQPPKTIADLKDIAEAFTTRDPNGNDKSDTFGLGITKDLWSITGTAGLEGFFNSYHAYPTIWVKDDSGNLAYGAVQPANKQALADLQEMYKAGWIDPEFGVKDGGRVSEDIGANKIGMLFGKMSTPFYFLATIMADPSIDWRPYPLPSIDATPASTQQDFPVQNYYVVRKGYEHPEAAVKMLNLAEEVTRTSDSEIHKRLKPKFDAALEKTEGFAAFPIIYGDLPTKNITAYLNIKKAMETKDESVLTTKEEKTSYEGLLDYINTKNPANVTYWLVFGPSGSQSVLNEYYSNKRYVGTEFYGAATPAMTTKQSTLNKLIVQEFTKIIVGNSSIDEFDRLVKDWNKIGGEQITKEVNDWKASR
ncbi:extracellular solute-binding protein [Cohnella thailandensis]|uniref:Extracellular solute-binding protein n=1 Tax=Cohnella thailandensis TaxID=557557 RepID=A0A841SZ57_9BACL|nr:extracellular solute-binding protein [Cohnella thailandensis]MBB6637194.1 extracellular solute-binding protein [Cohnella thailandensis]MBP1976984.1 putative aldouronate transport system substrate-binding protein [Cohnella thailandensis]